MLPLMIVILAWPTYGASLLLGLAYPLQAIPDCQTLPEAGDVRRRCENLGLRLHCVPLAQRLGRAPILVRPALGA